MYNSRRTYVPFTDEQKQLANSVDLAEYLSSRGETLKRSGREYQWEGHPGVTISGNRWYSHYDEAGGYPVKFLQHYFDCDYQDAMAELLGGHLQLTPLEWKPREQGRKAFMLPPPNADMRRVYAYLTKSRYIARSVIDHFVKTGSLYEDTYHNAVFVGFDETGTAKNAHKKGTLSDVKYRVNVSGSDNRYGFGHMGDGKKLHVFEAAIDLMSYLTLYPADQWKESYIALDGVSEHAMLQALEQHRNLKEVYLCLDHDPGGIEACGRLTDILHEKGYTQIFRLSPEMKDWNEMLKAQHGQEALPAVGHPKVVAMRALCESLAVEQQDTTRPYKKLFGLCDGYLKNHDSSFLYPAAKAALFCVKDQYEKVGKPVSMRQIAGHVNHTYQPHLDHTGLRARESELLTGLANIKKQMSPSGVYTAQQRMELARTLLQVGQLCLTTKIVHDQPRQSLKQTQSIAM